MEFGIKDIMVYFPDGEHSGKQFRYFHRGGTNEYRATLLRQRGYFVNNRVVLLPFGFVNEVVPVIPGDGSVSGDLHHIELIDFPEFPCFRNRSPRHPCQFFIHAEIILQGHRGKGLGHGLDFHVLLRFYGLVQPV